MKITDTRINERQVPTLLLVDTVLPARISGLWPFFLSVIATFVISAVFRKKL
jgi:hypothetical protein